MAKKKQREDQPAVNSVSPLDSKAATPSRAAKPSPAGSSSPTPEQQFKQFMDNVNKGFENMQAGFKAIDQRFKNQDAKIAAVAKVSAHAEEAAGGNPKPTNPMDIIHTVEKLLNSPIINKIAEQLMGGGAEQTAAAPPIDPALQKMIMEQQAKQQGFQDRWMEAMIKSVELKNDQLKKEMDSDLM